MGTSIFSKILTGIAAAGIALCVLAVANPVPQAAGQGTGRQTVIHVIDGVLRPPSMGGVTGSSVPGSSTPSSATTAGGSFPTTSTVP